MKYVLLLSGFFFGVFALLFSQYSADTPGLMLITPAVGAVFYIVIITFSPTRDAHVNVHSIGGAISGSGWIIKGLVGVSIAISLACIFLTMFIFSEHRLNANLDVYLKQVMSLGLAIVFFVFYLNTRIASGN